MKGCKNCNFNPKEDISKHTTCVCDCHKNGTCGENCDCGKDKTMITISRKEYEKLKEDSAMLSRLRAAGVDNWEGYEFAMSDDD